MKHLPIAIIQALCVVIWLSPAYAQENCGRATPVDSLGDIKYNYLALTSPTNTYAIDKSCIILTRREFRKVLPFDLLPANSDSTTALYIESYRAFSSNPPYKISLSRGGGWFFSKTQKGNAAAQKKLPDKPYPGSVESWNAAHSTAGTPLDFEGRLKVLWHAYANSDRTLSSTEDPGVWKTRPDFDFAHGTLTVYLLRFPPKSQTPIPFQVYLQDEVKHVDLVINSNVEALSGEYNFIIQ
jgi:hypothetical protein